MSIPLPPTFGTRRPSPHRGGRSNSITRGVASNSTESPASSLAGRTASVIDEILANSPYSSQNRAQPALDASKKLSSKPAQSTESDFFGYADKPSSTYSPVVQPVHHTSVEVSTPSSFKNTAIPSPVTASQPSTPALRKKSSLEHFDDFVQKELNNPNSKASPENLRAQAKSRADHMHFWYTTMFSNAQKAPAWKAYADGKPIKDIPAIPADEGSESRAKSQFLAAFYQAESDTLGNNDVLGRNRG